MGEIQNMQNLHVSRFLRKSSPTGSLPKTDELVFWNINYDVLITGQVIEAEEGPQGESENKRPRTTMDKD